MTRTTALAAVAATAAALSSSCAAFVPMTAHRPAVPHEPTANSGSVAIRDPTSSPPPSSSAEAAAAGRRGPLQMSLAPPPDETAADAGTTEMPVADENGIYEIKNKEQHQAFLKSHPDKVVVMKFYAPWCRACKGLEPKFVMIRKDKKYAKLPIVWAQMSIQHNKEYIKKIGVLALPSVHIYSGSEGLIENFPCGPSKVPVFKKKLASTLNAKIDPKTLQLKAAVVAPDGVDCTAPGMATTAPCADRSIVRKGDKTELSVGSAVVSEEMWNFLRRGVPFFKDLDEGEFNSLMSKAKLQTFEAGSVVMRQGMEGRTFYVIESGEVEISVNVAMASDPLLSPSGYLGAVINRLGEREYFGERSLITGNPRAASIRAVKKTRCFAFEIDDIPASSVLSGKLLATDGRLAQIDDKYGLDVVNLDISAVEAQAKGASVANQSRGSVNTPEVLPGVDTDEEVEEYYAPAEPRSADAGADAVDIMGVQVNGNDDMVISLLLRFQLIRRAARCFEYIVAVQPRWGDPGESRRRSMLVRRLTPAMREEFARVFQLIDADGNERVSILELQRAMLSVGEEKSEEELRAIINNADPTIDGNVEMGFQDFMGVMAEAELYYLFMETFRVLDKENLGFVSAGELDKALCGVRDLISDDRKTIIDVEDKNMLIDYEQFARMLLGAEVRH